jgi:DNA polymerase-1
MGFFEVQKIEIKKPKVIQDCSTCPLNKKTQVEFEGDGLKKILILTEKALTLEQSAWLEKQYNDSNLYYEDCWFTSVVQCECKDKDGKEKEPSNKIINCCRSQWQKIIHDLKPEKIFIFGHTALKSFIGDRMSDVGEMKRWVGHAIPDQDYGCWVFPLYDIDFVRTHKNEAVEYVFSDHLINTIEHNKEFLKHKETVNIITDVKEAIKYLRNIYVDNSDWLSFDYEGTGLKPYRKEQELISVSFSNDPYNCTSFPIFDNDEFHILLKQVLTTKTNKTAHSIGFEQKWTRHVLGFEQEGNAFCSMLACHVLDNRTHISGLKFQTYINYGVAGYDDEMKPFLTTVKDGEDEKSDNRLNNIHKAPLDRLLHYNALDSMFGYHLTMDQIEKLKEKKLDDQYDFLFDGVLALANITENGMRIDEDYYRKKEIELSDKLKSTEKQIHSSKEGLEWFKTQKQELDILSPDKVKKLILDVLKLKTTKKTAKGNYSVDKEVLKSLGEKNPFFNDIVTYRETHKIKGTYVEGFLRESIDGLIHPNQNLHTVTTYRPSTTNPNFANIPKRDPVAQKLVRSGVVPRKDHLLLTVDYSGIEVMSGCFYHKDPVMIDYVTNPANDMHRDQALRLFLLSPDQITKQIRYETKSGFVFPEFYGDYWRSCAKSMWSAISKLMTREDILLKDHLFDQGIKTYKQFESHVKEEERIFWKEKFKVFDRWKAEAWNSYLDLGYVEYLTGFRCGGVLDKKNVVNYPFQGTAFHLLLWSLIELEKETRTQGWDSQICLQVYDEMMFDVHLDELDDLVPLIRDTMTKKVRKQYPWINVPLSVEIKTSEVNGNWFEMEELK